MMFEVNGSLQAAGGGLCQLQHFNMMATCIGSVASVAGSDILRSRKIFFISFCVFQHFKNSAKTS